MATIFLGMIFITLAAVGVFFNPVITISIVLALVVVWNILPHIWLEVYKNGAPWRYRLKAHKLFLKYAVVGLGQLPFVALSFFVYPIIIPLTEWDDDTFQDLEKKFSKWLMKLGMEPEAALRRGKRYASKIELYFGDINGLNGDATRIWVEDHEKGISYPTTVPRAKDHVYADGVYYWSNASAPRTVRARFDWFGRNRCTNLAQAWGVAVPEPRASFEVFGSYNFYGGGTVSRQIYMFDKNGKIIAAELNVNKPMQKTEGKDRVLNFRVRYGCKLLTVVDFRFRCGDNVAMFYQVPTAQVINTSISAKRSSVFKGIEGMTDLRGQPMTQEAYDGANFTGKFVI